MPLSTRPISWIRAALRDFQDFPESAQTEILRALVVAAEGGKADIAKPMKGFGSGVFEVALKYRGDAFRTVYAVQIGDALWSFTPSRRNPRAASRPQSKRSTSFTIG